MSCVLLLKPLILEVVGTSHVRPPLRVTNGVVCLQMHPSAAARRHRDDDDEDEDDEEEEEAAAAEGEYADGEGDPCPNCGRVYRWAQHRCLEPPVCSGSLRVGGLYRSYDSSFRVVRRRCDHYSC